MSPTGVIASCLDALREGSPQETRRALCRVLLEEGGGDAALFFTLVPDDECSFRHAATVVVGDARCREVLGALEGRRFEAVGSWRPDAPPPPEVGRFTSLRRSRSPALQLRIARREKLYRQLGVEDHARMLVYDGPVLVGWIGVLRLAGSPPFAESELRHLDALADEVAAVLVACHERERADERELPVSVLLRPDGRVDLATPGARDWLDLHGTEPLRRALAEAPEDGTGEPVAVGVHRVRVVPMRAPDGGELRYLATVERAPAVSAALWAQLPRRQREVAQHAASGATTPEIARALGVSPETVRSQLKTVYRTLGIGSRAELATLLAAGEE